MNKIFLLLFLTGFTIKLFNQIKFDANFESGNLNTVTTSDSINFTITTKQDIGGRWFYFRISGVKDKFIKCNVTSSDVKRAVYSYDNKSFERFSATESPATNVFQKTYTKDTVWVAYYIPYNYSFLQERLQSWKHSPYSKLDTLGWTLRNFPIQELIITDKSIPDSLKYHVWIHARTHPGETTGSWQFDGLVQKLLEESDLISYYRKKIVYHLIPFTNPDGVYFGRSRTNFDGIDVESNWDKPDSSTCKEVKILKVRMTEINSKKVISVFQNLHAQATQSCTFWIHTASSTSDYYYRRELQFCNLNTSENPFFEKIDYSFSSLLPRFPEGWLWNLHSSNVLALTYETPYDFYSTDLLVTNENLKWLGEKLIYSISEFLEISHPKRLLLDNKNIVSNWIKDTTGTEFFGANYLKNNNQFLSPIKYESEVLPSGKYDIYSWWQSKSDNAFDTKFKIEGGGQNISLQKSQKLNGGQWNFLASVNLFNSGKISITISDSASGVVIADAFRINYIGQPSKIEIETPKEFVLYQNYPNPFFAANNSFGKNTSTTIQFKLNEKFHVKLKVFNVLGEIISTIVDEELNAGDYRKDFNSSILKNLSSGIYYYQLSTDKRSETKAMLYLK